MKGGRLGRAQAGFLWVPETAADARQGQLPRGSGGCQARVPGDSWTRCRHGAHSCVKPSCSCWEHRQPVGLCVPLLWGGTGELQMGPPGRSRGSGLSVGLCDTSHRLELTGRLGEASLSLLLSSSELFPARSVQAGPGTIPSVTGLFPPTVFGLKCRFRSPPPPGSWCGGKAPPERDPRVPGVAGF